MFIYLPVSINILTIWLIRLATILGNIRFPYLVSFNSSVIYVTTRTPVTRTNVFLLFWNEQIVYFEVEIIIATFKNRSRRFRMFAPTIHVYILYRFELSNEFSNFTLFSLFRLCLNTFPPTFRSNDTVCLYIFSTVFRINLSSTFPRLFLRSHKINSQFPLPTRRLP